MDEVNIVMNNGMNAGGIEPSGLRDYGFMKQRTIEDFDGHTWEIFYLIYQNSQPNKTIYDTIDSVYYKYPCFYFSWL